MAKKLSRAEKIAMKSIEDIVKLKGEEGHKQLISDVKALQFAYKRRVGAFKRKGLISHAQLALERETPQSKPVPLTEMSRTQLIYEFFKYAQFFQAETSTEAGIKRVNREQDIRIFGADARGNPKRTMTDEERTLYWDTYEEFKNQYPADINSVYSSEQIQQFIADAIYGRKRKYTRVTTYMLRKIRKNLRQNKLEENMEDVPNVLSGRRSNLKW